uniref:Uncharacterized protein n=1 Tax=Palpitomonas bilix TaxID=652834 RepID=A0A7S3GA26_9EUKA
MFFSSSLLVPLFLPLFFIRLIMFTSFSRGSFLLSLFFFAIFLLLLACYVAALRCSAVLGLIFSRYSFFFCALFHSHLHMYAYIYVHEIIYTCTHSSLLVTC